MANKTFHFNGIQAILTDIKIPADRANLIATASQAVDDFYEDKLIIFDDGTLFYPVVTAHRMLDRNNLDSRDASNIWMPFHFFPDDDGVCRPETNNTSLLIDFVKEKIQEPSCSEREKDIYIGILLHILVDTYTHQGFMGLHCRHNDISALDDENAIDMTVWANVAPCIGHGEASTYPDDSWRIWSYKDSHDQKQPRNNPESFLSAVLQIPKVLKQLGLDNAGFDDANVEKYKEIILQKENHAENFDKITRANVSPDADITYKHWKELALRGVQSSENVYKIKNPDSFESSEWFLFQQAARHIRAFFKQRIFPKLVVKTKVY